jgi:hypothetical protein
MVVVSPPGLSPGVSLSGAAAIFPATYQVTIPANSSSGSFGIQCQQPAVVFSGVTVVVTATLGVSAASATVLFTPP